MTDKSRKTRGASRTMRFSVEGALLELPRDDGLDLLEWLGLGRPEFGAIEARELAPRCRRRLWPLPRNVDAAVLAEDGRERRAAGSLGTKTRELLILAERADGQGLVTFG